MGIPTKADYSLREIEDLAANVLVRLTTLRHTPGRRDIDGLRDTLQAYVNSVMALAHDGE